MEARNGGGGHDQLLLVNKVYCFGCNLVVDIELYHVNSVRYDNVNPPYIIVYCTRDQ